MATTSTLLVQRGLGNATAPAVQTKLDIHPTLLFSWWCTGFAVAIIAVRLFGRMVRNNRLFKEDKIMALSLLPLLFRMGLVHVVLIWQTNNVDISGGLTDLEIHHRSIGSKLVLVSRIMYALFIWMAKFTISEFLKRLTASYWKRSYEMVLHFIRIFLAATFVAVVIAILAECHPFSHYWQVIPDPGPRCRQGYAQLLTMGVSDMLTDVLLIVFPISIIIRSGMPLIRKIKLIPLFGLNAVLIVITVFRILAVIENNGRQQSRTVYASGEILAAAAVSNAVILGSFLRDRGVKKAKYKRNPSSATDSSDGPNSRRLTMTKQALGSDEDLFKGMCYRSSHDDVEAAVPRPPPIAVGVENKYANGQEPWNTPSYDIDSDGISASRLRQDSMTAPHESIKLNKTVTFSDAGGLLDNVSSQASTVVGSPSSNQGAFRDFRSSIDSGPSTPRNQNFTTSSHNRSGSRSDDFEDIGGLLK